LLRHLLRRGHVQDMREQVSEFVEPHAQRFVLLAFDAERTIAKRDAVRFRVVVHAKILASLAHDAVAFGHLLPRLGALEDLLSEIDTEARLATEVVAKRIFEAERRLRIFLGLFRQLFRSAEI
jgi:hypothetical protein